MPLIIGSVIINTGITITYIDNYGTCIGNRSRREESSMGCLTAAKDTGASLFQ